jgi:hypothetical protein
MQEMIASFFIIFVLALYAGISLVFVIGGIRKWIWRPIAGKSSAVHPERSYNSIKPTSQEQEGSPS